MVCETKYTSNFDDIPLDLGLFVNMKMLLINIASVISLLGGVQVTLKHRINVLSIDNIKKWNFKMMLLKYYVEKLRKAI